MHFSGISKSLIILLLAVSLFSCGSNDKKNGEANSKIQDQALTELNELIREDPKNPELLFQRAELYYKHTAYDEALDDLGAAQKIDSLKPEYYHLLADVYMDYYKSHFALKTMEKVVSLHPRRVPSLLKLAEFQYILKKYEKSIYTCNEVLAVDRTEPEAFFMLGMNFREIGDSERAKNSFQTAVEFDPQLIDAWLLLGTIYEAEKNPKALTYYESAVLMAPESVEALHAKAFYLQNHGNIPEAITIYRKINELDPQYTDAYLNSGLLFMELDSVKQAREYFNLFVKKDLTNPIGYFYRGVSNEALGNLKNARLDYEQALRLSPDFEDAQKALDDLNSKAKKKNPSKTNNKTK
jgi:tetratricopeptide (TPR) repeat protein